MLDGKAFAAEVVEMVRGHVERATAPLLLRIADLEQKLAAIPAGPAGRDADPLLIRTLVADAVAALPAPKDGIGVAGGLIDRSGVFVLTLSDGTVRELGVVVGRDGASGADGQKGDPGEAGPQGPAGRDGADGRDGVAGLPGVDGAHGKDGARGPAGEKGDAGDAGAAGPPGINGKDGRDGVDGRDGAPGEKGLPGETGAQGPAGEPGLAGKDGAPGLNGKDGSPGPAGERGEPGSDGKDGAPGADGRHGLDGKDGSPGIAGKNGADGRDGVDGLPGERGLAGKDGADGRDGVGLADALIDRDDNLVLTMSDGRAKSLGVVVGRDGVAGADGKDGAPGFSLEDFDTELLADGRSVAFKFTRGDTTETHEIAFPVAIYRGVFELGAPYQPGDMVSHGGNVWHCNAATIEKPGDAKVWTMAVRRGRDGKDVAP